MGSKTEADKLDSKSFPILEDLAEEEDLNIKVSQPRAMFAGPPVESQHEYHVKPCRPKKRGNEGDRPCTCCRSATRSQRWRYR